MLNEQLSPELQKQIEQEAETITAGFKDTNDYEGGIIQGYKEGYEDAGDKYASKWQAEKELRERYEKALKIIQAWQLPPTGQFWDIDKLLPMSYAACYGSNGERDFMRNVANQALTPKTSEDDK